MYEDSVEPGTDEKIKLDIKPDKVYTLFKNFINRRSKKNINYLDIESKISYKKM
jgi:hypothetical protein